MGKKAEMRRRRHARRGRQRAIIYSIAGLVAIGAIVAIVSAVIAANNRNNAAADGDYVTTASGLQYRIIEEGSGPKPQLGDQLTVQYRGTLEDGTEFDSGTFDFTLGVDPVIEGWVEGMQLLNEGTTAEFIIPPDLGYGAGGNPPVIPPNATLMFEVTLLEVNSN